MSLILPILFTTAGLFAASTIGFTLSANAYRIVAILRGEEL